MFIICIMLFIDSDKNKNGHQHLLKIKTHTTFLNFSLANWVTFKVNFILKDISLHIKSLGTRYSINYHRCKFDSISSPFHLAYMKLDLSAISHFSLLSAPRNPHYLESVDSNYFRRKFTVCLFSFGFFLALSTLVHG